MQVPCSGLLIGQHSAMGIRAVLAANFNKLRKAAPALYSLKDITKAGGGPNGTLGRISAGTVGAGVDTVEKIAVVYGIEPWQMLYPALQASESQSRYPRIGGLPNWPFADIDRARFDKLSPRQQVEIQAAVRAWIEKFENDGVPVKRHLKSVPRKEPERRGGTDRRAA